MFFTSRTGPRSAPNASCKRRPKNALSGCAASTHAPQSRHGQGHRAFAHPEEAAALALANPPVRVEAFGFIPGLQRRTFRHLASANIKAAEPARRLRQALADAGHRVHAPKRFLVRVVFCVSADDTGVFPRSSWALPLRHEGHESAKRPAGPPGVEATRRAGTC